MVEYTKVSITRIPSRIARTTIPESMREHLGINTETDEKQHISWHANGDKSVTIKKALAVIAVGILALAFISPTLAYAQDAVNEIDKFNEPAQTTSSITGEFIETYTFEGPSAYTPWRIEITYPKGIQDIQNITSSSASFPFSLVTSGDNPTGFITKSFSTEMITTFSIELGQVYEQPMNDVGTIVIYSNNTLVAQYLLHVDGLKFHKKFVVETGQAPHFPTTEEILASMREPLDTLITNTATINERVDSHNREASVTLETQQGVSIVMFLAAIILIGVTGANYSISRQRRENRESRKGAHISITESDQPVQHQARQKPKWRFW